MRSWLFGLTNTPFMSTFNALHAGERITTILDKFVEIQPFKVGALFLVVKLFCHFVTNAS